jgi:predicted lipid-binding transport protein (Tim44 family)
MNRLRSKIALALVGALTLALTLAAPAEARRGGSFGSRGARTYSAPTSTAISPGYAAPVQRSMTAPPAGYTPRPGYAQPAYGYNNGYNNGYQPRFRPGFGTGLGAGLLTGGLLGAAMGHGFGGGWGGYGGMGGMGGMGGGIFASLIQLAILGLVIWFAVRLFRRGRPQANTFAYDPAPAGGPWGGGPQPAPLPWDQNFGGPPAGGPWGGAQPAPQSNLSLSPADQQAFERLLIEVQDAFGREDYADLRARCTPEVMGYLAEELSDNATHGRKNEVQRVRLIRSEVSEAWREADADYATVALNYESIDVMRDRQSGQVLSGDPDHATATTEIWTFVRRGGEDWKLSAIQET